MVTLALSRYCPECHLSTLVVDGDDWRCLLCSHAVPLAVALAGAKERPSMPYVPGRVMAQ
jgi:hypothetical protein